MAFGSVLPFLLSTHSVDCAVPLLLCHSKALLVNIAIFSVHRANYALFLQFTALIVPFRRSAHCTKCALFRWHPALLKTCAEHYVLVSVYLICVGVRSGGGGITGMATSWWWLICKDLHSYCFGYCCHDHRDLYLHGDCFSYCCHDSCRVSPWLPLQLVARCGDTGSTSYRTRACLCSLSTRATMAVSRRRSAPCTRSPGTNDSRRFRLFSSPTNR